MWGLDRLSGSNTQAASTPSNYPYSSRPYSPSPRRSTAHVPQNTRPALAGRASSQISLSSTSSLPHQSATSRFVNGSSLKHQLTSSPVAQVDDPLEVLDRLVGPPGEEAAKDGTIGPAKKPSNISSDIDFHGLSLQEFIDQDAQVAPSSIKPQLTDQPVEEYEKERHKFEDLHKSITSCDDVLKSVENYLSSFQADLGTVSTEIETLQTRSSVLNGQLENRRKVEKLLGPTVDRIGLPSMIVKKISEGPVDEAWAKALANMKSRIDALDAEDLAHIHAVKDLRPLIESLSDKAAERIKEYFAAQIRSLRSPNVNAQLIQQQGFLKFRSLYLFLSARQPQLAEEIMQAYSNTMRWYYYTSFNRYHASLTKMKVYSTDRFDAIGEDPTSQARHRNTPTGSNTMPSQDVFSLGRRMEILRSPTTVAIPSHAADESKQTHHIETPFQAFNLALIDNASFEYSFLTTFFSLSETGPRPQNGTESQQTSTTSSNITAINRHFTAIFSPVLNLGSSLTKSLVGESYDALGILILVRLTQHFAHLLQRRRIPSLESYINGTSMMLWPRFQVVIDTHCNSLKQLTASLSNRASASNASANTFVTLSGGSGGTASTAPHPITQRFANFAHAIVTLSSEAADDEPVANSFTRLRGEFESFLKKASGAFGSGEKARKDKKRFMINNYSLILTVLSDCKGKLADEVRQDFENLKQENV